ncbi:MAG: Maf family protein, partial [Candidatus Thermoplasmatota archaeon]|nr:Maf family protein [Candidatus Thermoplasmatota archaeon]
MSDELVLASASPRRRRLLGEAGLSFSVDPARIEEILPPGPIEGAVEQVSLEKARAVAARHPE